MISALPGRAPSNRTEFAYDPRSTYEDFRAMTDFKMFDLTGKVAVVTGGNGGIGLGYARGLAKAGANIAIWARNAKKSEAAKAELTELGAEVLSLSCDVGSEEETVAAVKATLDRFGRIDSCFANAGFGHGADPLKLEMEDWRRVMRVNLDGVFLSFRETAKHMVERGGGGKLVATSSITEIFGAPIQPHYAASKGALGALVRSMAVRLGRHDIQVNGILPGWIKTDATDMASGNEKFQKIITGRTPARRWGTTEDLEGIAVYLASDASRFHTGDSLRVDGGYAIF
jgi:NAD(P)-dependent dehydrogenase (short-subunit alcohol dehydrogenase family)